MKKEVHEAVLEYKILNEKVDPVEKALLKIFLEEGINLLDEKEKQVIVLHFFYDFSWQEIAELCGESKSKVYSRYRMGLDILREYFIGSMK